MDAPIQLLNDIKNRDLARGHFLGLLNLLIGRRIEKSDGTLVSNGITWRELASLLKRVRWSKDTVEELPLANADFAPRDRERFWYMVIAHASVDSEPARAAGDKFALVLNNAGYVIGAAPGAREG